jgi:hypothetical protein
MRYTIDRFENGWAVCEDAEGNTHNLPRGLLPAEAREGDALDLDTGRLSRDGERAAQKLDRLFL